MLILFDTVAVLVVFFYREKKIRNKIVEEKNAFVY